MVSEVLQPRLDAPVVFAGHEDESAGSADLLRELFKGCGSFALRVLLVHPIKHRQVYRLGVDQFDIVAPAPQPLDDEFGQTDARSIRPIGAVENKNPVAHHNSLCGRNVETACGSPTVGDPQPMVEMPPLAYCG